MRFQSHFLLLSLVFTCCGLGPILYPISCANLSAQVPSAPVPSSQFRTWTDPTGKHQTVAEMVGSDETTVTLKKENGKTISVPLTRLCESDQEFIKNLANSKVAPVPTVPANPKTPPEVKENVAPASVAAPPASVAAPPASVAAPPASAPAVPLESMPEPTIDPNAEKQETANAVSADDLAQLLASKKFSELRDAFKKLKKNWPKKPDPNLRSTLVSASQSEEKFTRLLALELLAEHSSLANFDAIAERMQDRSFEVRWKSYEVLAEIGNEQALEKLLEKYTGEDLNKISSVLETFGPTAEVAVLQFLTDPAKNIRLTTCNLLGKIGTDRSVPSLENLRDNDSELSVRFQAKNALERIADRPAKEN